MSVLFVPKSLTVILVIESQSLSRFIYFVKKILVWTYFKKSLSFPDGSVVKESACQYRRGWFDPWVGKDPLVEEMETHSSILVWKIQ